MVLLAIPLTCHFCLRGQPPNPMTQTEKDYAELMKLDSFLVEKLDLSHYLSGQITQYVWREILKHQRN